MLEETTPTLLLFLTACVYQTAHMYDAYRADGLCVRA
jgi:hypothetical protein